MPIHHDFVHTPYLSKLMITYIDVLKILVKTVCTLCNHTRINFCYSRNFNVSTLINKYIYKIIEMFVIQIL